MKILSVYNICGISGSEDIDYYDTALRSLLAQKNIDQDVVISSCMSSQSTIDKLSQKFPNIKINSITEKVPVNVSFNHTCNIFDDGTYDGFLYIDSGIIFTNESIIHNMIERMKSGPYAMVCCITDTDQGVSLDNVGNLKRGKGLVPDNLGLCVSIGSSLNLHCQIFSREIKQFFGNIIPDIFAGFCTESVLSFICASIQKRWAVNPDVVKHVTGIDGQSSGFKPDKWIQSTGRQTYDHPFAINSYMDRFLSNEAKMFGLGFEECRNVAIHDPNQYDKEMFCVNNDLKFYIKKNLYLNKQEFNYDNIQHYLRISDSITNSKENYEDFDFTKYPPETINTVPLMGNDGWSLDYKISVIIPTRGRSELLRKCLTSLLDYSYKKDRLFEIILVIDNDDTETLKTAIELQSKFNFYSNIDNTEANSLSIMIIKRSEYMQRDYNNAAAIAAKGKLVFVLNDDVTIETKNWDQIIYNYYLTNKNQEDIMLISISDDSHDALSKDSLGNTRSQETHGPCFPIVTKTFINLTKGIFPSNIRMWGADIVLHRIFKQINKVYTLEDIKILHNSFHSSNRQKDETNRYIETISSKSQYLLDTNSYIQYINSLIVKKQNNE